MDLSSLTQPGAPRQAAAEPDVLIMDVRAHGQVPSALWTLKRQHPTTSVMLVAGELTPGLMLEAMRAGVTECVAEPLTSEALAEAVSRIIAQRTGPASGQIFAFVGAKGGMGTTTLAVNVATAFARSQRSTLFVDMHQGYGDATVLFGAEQRFSWLDALGNTHRLDLSFFNGLTVQTSAGVTLLAAPDDAPAAPIDANRIRLLLDFAIRNYQHTVLDLPRSSPAILEALDAATSIFVVTDQELASVRGASRVANTLRRRYSRDKVSVVVSRFDKDADIGISDIEDVVHSDVRYTFPNDYRVALQALNTGKPFVLAGNSQLASSVNGFVKLLNGETLVERAHPLKPRSLARLAAVRWMTP
jgi:pilus assembly protein CpaE